FSEKLPSGAYPAAGGEANPGVVVCVEDEGDPLTFSLVAGPQHGAIAGLPSEGESAFFAYTPGAGHLGPDVATIRARDPAGGEDLLTLALEVGSAANTGPACTASLSAPLSGASYRVVAGEPVAGEISCADPDLDTLSFGVAQPPTHGTLSALIGTGDSRSFTYTAASSHRGPDQFTLEANDGSAEPEPVAIALLVVAPDAAMPPTDDGSGQGKAPAPRAGQLPPVAKAVSCAQLKGQARARCLLDQRVTRSCGKLKGKRKATCAKRIRALAKCDAIKAKGKPGQARKDACRKQAQAIGKPA
ncbi:MAG TPA: Ig-like domain-containing protein, partial [Solirubrobacterales bacterium]|nr:Ig-like domain-containing protein [Solirubrobacterales bacterium]